MSMPNNYHLPSIKLSDNIIPKNKSIMRIGILGGTFDPPHYGHISPAKQTAKWLNLDKLLILPANIPPHKERTFATTEQRLAMVNILCQKDPFFILDDRELKRQSLSYTVDTLQEIKNEHPSWQLFFIMGMDSLLTFTTWYQWQKILTLCHLVVNTRPGFELGSLNCETQKLLAEHRLIDVNKIHSSKTGSILFHETTTNWDISSTMVRQKLKEKNDCSELLPLEIITYINNQQLYR